MPADLLTATVSDDELSRYARLIYERTGISISPQKKTLLSNRLRRRLRETGIGSFEDYYRHLKQLAATDAEWDAFLQEITTHETYLFRDETQWRWFRESYLAEINSAARSGKRARELRVWSAACSTGDEPLTIAACIAAELTNLTQWKVEIVGTDIGIGALEQARLATYGERSMRLVPEDIAKRYFTRDRQTNAWKAKPPLTSLLRFRQHNLMEPFCEKPFDLVFLKNVLIYFDRPAKTTVLTHVRAMLKPGGLLVSGAAEGVSELLGDMQRLQPWLFRKIA